MRTVIQCDNSTLKGDISYRTSREPWSTLAKNHTGALKALRDRFLMWAGI